MERAREMREKLSTFDSPSAAALASESEERDFHSRHRPASRPHESDAPAGDRNCRFSITNPFSFFARTGVGGVSDFNSSSRSDVLEACLSLTLLSGASTRSREATRSRRNP
jgi:hypothetical protein